jgi:putative ABC transport system permease protein
MVNEELAQDVGLQVGEHYTLLAQDKTQSGSSQTTQFDIRISGIWQPTDPENVYWVFGPNYLRESFLVAEDSFIGNISPALDDEIYTGLWYFVMDSADVHASDAGILISRIYTIQKQADRLLPGIRLGDSPLDDLVAYQRDTRTLTILLYAFSVPILGLVLAFINLVAGLSVERQRAEIAVLRSRGATLFQIIGIVFLEGALLGIIALVFSTPIALQLAKTIGNTRSFLDFGADIELRIGLTEATIQAGLIAICIAVFAQVLPTINAARHTIVTYKQERARLLQPPWWQRAWLDVMLFIPAAYGTYLLREQGSIVLIDYGASAGDMFQNPLLFLVPALGIFALALFILRLIPPIMAGVAWIASHTNSVGLYLATRHISRTRGSYTTPLVLLILTLSLSAYTASLASTLDTHLQDKIYYQVGADMNFYDIGESTGLASILFEPQTDVVADEDPGPRWYFFPVVEYVDVPGVQAASRVGRYPADIQLSIGGFKEGAFIGVDRLDFPKVAFWRRDFSQESLGALMNALAAVRDGILVSSDFMRSYDLHQGDEVRLTVSTSGQQTELSFRIVGCFDLFPTWYPDEGPLFVGNLDYLHQQAGSQFPYRVWLSTTSDVDFTQLGDVNLRELNKRVTSWDAAPTIISDIQGSPERQGLFGLLSIGFAAAAVLTVFGFLLYSLFSFRRRMIELGVLRASGLSTGQMIAFLAWELIILILFGGGVGTVLGAWTSKLYIPFLQIGEQAGDKFPPFLVDVAWSSIFQVYALFGLLFVITLIILVFLLRRMRIFQAIKLGETI